MNLSGESSIRSLHSHTVRGDSSTQVLDELMTQMCRRLAFLAVTRAKPIGKSEIGRIKPGSSAPMRVEDLAGEYASRYATAKGRGARSEELLVVIKDAQDAWLQVAFGPAPERVRGTLDWKIAVATDPRPSHVVGRAYGLSSSYVRKLRREKREGKLSRNGKLRSGSLVD